MWHFNHKHGAVKQQQRAAMRIISKKSPINTFLVEKRKERVNIELLTSSYGQNYAHFCCKPYTSSQLAWNILHKLFLSSQRPVLPANICWQKRHHIAGYLENCSHQPGDYRRMWDKIHDIRLVLLLWEKVLGNLRSIIVGGKDKGGALMWLSSHSTVQNRGLWHTWHKAGH